MEDIFILMFLLLFIILLLIPMIYIIVDTCKKHKPEPEKFQCYDEGLDCMYDPVVKICVNPYHKNNGGKL